MAKESKERSADYKERLREKGWLNINIWLDREARKKLELFCEMENLTRNEAIDKVITTKLYINRQKAEAARRKKETFIKFHQEKFKKKAK